MTLLGPVRATSQELLETRTVRRRGRVWGLIWKRQYKNPRRAMVEMMMRITPSWAASLRQCHPMQEATPSRRASVLPMAGSVR